VRTLYSAAVVGCLLCSTPSFAISNIENQRPGPPNEGFSGQLALGLSGKTGDKREEDYTLNSRLNYRQGDDVLFVIATREYGSTRKVKDTDDSFIHTRWVHNLTRHWAGEAFLQWEEDTFSNLISRSLIGGGARYLALNKAGVYSLALGIGAFREFETLDLSTYKLDTNVWRLNTYYAYNHVLNASTSIVSTVYLQPASNDIEDMRALFTFNLNVKMSDSLNLGLGYEAKYDSHPAKNLAATPIIDKSKSNTAYTTTLSYQF
jgi:hypothetical protein